MEKIVYGLNGSRIETMIHLQQMLEESIILSDSFKEKIMNQVQKIMLECFNIGKKASDQVE